MDQQTTEPLEPVEPDIFLQKNSSEMKEKLKRP